jgi:hypothetical protein
VNDRVRPRRAGRLTRREILALVPPDFTPTGMLDLKLATAIQRHAANVLIYTRGNVSWAAQELGINSVTLWRWRRAWELGRRVRPQLSPLVALKARKPSGKEVAVG